MDVLILNAVSGVEDAVALIVYEAAGLAGSVQVAVQIAVEILFDPLGIEFSAIDEHVDPVKLPPVELGVIVTVSSKQPPPVAVVL